MILKLTDENYNEAIQTAISVLNDGGIIAYPTETFYALGAKYDNKNALKKLFEMKRRPEEKAMPLIIGDMEQLGLLADHISGLARELMNKFWPGPLTLVLFAREGLDEYIVSGKKVAVRIPGESFALELAKAAGFPITATSANVSDGPPAMDASMVTACLGRGIGLIIDGGETKGGLPSTIVDVTGDRARTLRKGAMDIL